MFLKTTPPPLQTLFLRLWVQLTIFLVIIVLIFFLQSAVLVAIAVSFVTVIIWLVFAHRIDKNLI